MDTILFVSVIILLSFSIGMILYFSFKSIKENNIMFDYGISGVYIISENCSDPEILLRELISYIRRNNIRCFRIIYIKVRNNDTETLAVCRKICSDYPVFELLENKKAE